MQSSDFLPSDEIHLHVTDDPAITDPALLAGYEALLTTEEAERRDRFHFPRDRHQFLVARALVRTTLTRYYPEIRPADWRFAANDYGRPYIVGAGAGLFDFNLSHTKERMVLAVCRSASPGVDIERTDAPDGFLDIASRFFAASEVGDLNLLPAAEQEGRFFALWTMKEAYIKARGMGLSIALEDFAITFGPERPSIEFADGLADDPRRWQLFALDGGKGYALSLALPDAAVVRPLLFRATPLLSVEPIQSDQADLPTFSRGHPKSCMR